MLTRKQFLRGAVNVAAAALGLTVLEACAGTRGPEPAPDALGGTGGNGSGSGGGGSGSNESRCEMSGTTSTIADNHGHVLVVSAQDVTAGAAKQYHIRGTSDHDHTVDLTTDHFLSLQANRAIMTTSSLDADHTHAIMVACA